MIRRAQNHEFFHISELPFLATALVLLLFSLSTSTYGFGFLSEYINAEGTSRRTTTSSVLSSDIMYLPKWRTNLPLQFYLCTDNDFSSAFISYKTTRTSELLDDVTTATQAWQTIDGVSGSDLSFATPTTQANCSAASLGGESALVSNRIARIRFFDLDSAFMVSGILAFTPVNSYSLEGDDFFIDQADIWFNSASSVTFSTTACHTTTPGGTCDLSEPVFSFKGVLVHEMGHLLGLSHSMIYSDSVAEDTATMFPAVSDLSTSRASETLHVDDKVSRLVLYPGSSMPPGYTGVISGRVRRSASLGQRAAHVFAWDRSAQKMITGVFTALSGGVRSANEGAYTLYGVPLDTNIYIGVEPVEQDDDLLPFLDYDRFSFPMQVALEDEDDGFLDFSFEVYPDTSTANLRLSPASTISGAQSLSLTSASNSASDVDFYLSQSDEAPNDAADLDIAFGNTNTTITDSNPLEIVFSVGTDLSILQNTTVTVTASTRTSGSPLQGGGRVVTEDWSGGLPELDFSGTEQVLTIDAGAFDPADGSYTVTLEVTDSVYGTFEDEIEITVRNWNGSGVTADTGGGGGGGGGCALRVSTYQNQHLLLLEILLSLSLFLFRRNIRQSFQKRKAG